MEYKALPAIEEIFDLHTSGVKTNRDDVVYDWDRETPANRVKSFISAYNAEVYGMKTGEAAVWPGHINWSRDLKQDAQRGSLAHFQDDKIVQEPGVGVFASSRNAAIRFCRVRRLISNISAARLRLPRT